MSRRTRLVLSLIAEALAGGLALWMLVTFINLNA